ncbi:endonuclease SmrB [Alteromonas sp. DY56-G5]|uniref:endonuclease SmrB n=1 Tax=Alteromonas TaxID=226 RepID=UPI000C7609F1|nr:endonuclease SmrB [Alteromonas macleodii]AUI81830.1 endonuclease SmrB [Alteromonas macleodii]MEC8451009.1 endonuclease SmrB [Pseudomonadota bacterium]
MKTFKKELKALKRQLSEPHRHKSQARQEGARNGNMSTNTEEEAFSFADAMQGVTPLSQDKVEPDKQVELFKKSQQVKGKHLKHSKQLAASFDFSDMYQAALPQEGPMRFCQEGESTHILKQLRRGDYSPEMTLDLHGLTREMAKAELAALIHTARKELIDCVCVMHGFGQGVLKAALPHYLVQHPQVRAFHQAPLEYGGQAALLVLIDIPLQNNKR